MYKKFKKEFGGRIRFLRELAGLTQDQLADRVGLSSRKSISYIENGKNTVSFTRLPRFAESLGVPIYKLFILKDSSDDITTRDELNKLLESATDKELNVIAGVVKNILSLN